MAIDINKSDFKSKDVYNKNELIGLDKWTDTHKTGLDSKGRKYEIYTRNFNHKSGWKFLKGLQAFLATIFSLGFALISKDIRTLWQQSIDGKEHKSIKVLAQTTAPKPYIPQSLWDKLEKKRLAPKEQPKEPTPIQPRQTPFVEEVEEEEVILPTQNQSQSKKLAEIIEKRRAQFPKNDWAKLTQFLIGTRFKYEEKDYDLGFENNFDVGWIDPTKDRKFLEKMAKDYPTAMKALENEEYFKLNNNTRFANNNIAELFSLAKEKKCPEIVDLIKESMIYLLLRDFS